MMIAQEMGFAKSFGILQGICEFLQEAGPKGLRIDEVERDVLAGLIQLGLALSQEFVDQQGDGDVGESVTIGGRELQRSDEPKRRRYLGPFGELGVSRFVYSAGKKKAHEYVPLDARLGMPAGEISYVLEDFQERLSVKSPYAKAAEDLKAILGTATSVATAERLNQEMGADARGYQLSIFEEERVPPPEDEGELLVAAADGKGVVIRRTLEERLEEEREAGADESPRKCTDPPSAPQAKTKADKEGNESSKKNRKQMAYVGAVYTIDRFRRTADDVMDEIARHRRNKERPRPQNKRVWGEMTRLHEGELLDGRSSLFLNLAVDCEIRDPGNQKTLICLMDGEEPLWDAKRRWLDRAIEILDFFHVLERLWEVARQFHQGRAADLFVDHHTRMLLEGKVDYVVRNFRRFLHEKGLRGKKAKTVERAIAYFRHNRRRMRYDEYIAQGYPIGSGVAEGTCRNLVKDRMELTGMKWEFEGAQAMIRTRACYLNGEWDEFVKFRVEREQERLYGENTLYAQVA